MPDSSTTTGPIPDLKTQSCWARRWLHAGIGYVSVASVSMKLLTTLEGVFRIRYSGDPRTRCRFLYNHLTDPGSEDTGLLGLTSATRWYKVRLRRINIHEIVNYSGGGL